MTDQAGPMDAPPAPTAYTIAGEGDTLEACAARLGVPPEDLFAANRGVIGSDPAAVRFGMRLEAPPVPAPAPAEPAPAEGA